MTILAYSELLRRIGGIEEKKVEQFYKVIASHNITSLRYKALKNLAKQDKSTIGKLLQNLNVNKSGGCYITIKKFFLEMNKNGILDTVVVGNRTYWKFSDKAKHLKLYLKY